MEPPEIVEVNPDEQIACDGGAYYGHPKVYLSLAADGTVDCYYCGRRFQLREREQESGKSAA